MRLNGKIALITGSTNGIGEVTARLFVQHGAKVMLHGRNETAAKKLVAEFGADKVAYFIGDLAEADVCEKLIDATVKHFGALDILINNASITHRSTIETTDAQTFDWLMALNLRAPLLLIQHALKVFRKNNCAGVVVNIGSINAHCGERELLLYSMTKGGMMTLTRNLGHVLAKEKIRVNQLNVGWTATQRIKDDVIRDMGVAKEDEWQKGIPAIFAPSGALVSPEAVAKHVLFWASDESAPVTGAIYEVEQYSIYRNLIPEGLEREI